MLSAVDEQKFPQTPHDIDKGVIQRGCDRCLQVCQMQQGVRDCSIKSFPSCFRRVSTFPCASSYYCFGEPTMVQGLGNLRSTRIEAAYQHFTEIPPRSCTGGRFRAIKHAHLTSLLSINHDNSQATAAAICISAMPAQLVIHTPMGSRNAFIAAFPHFWV